MILPDLVNLTALALIGLMAGLMILLAVLGNRFPWAGLRSIPAINRLRHAIGLAVEAGTRLHISVGRGGLTDSRSAASFAGLTVLNRVARTASVSDRPPIATVGDGSLSILASDTLRTAYEEISSNQFYDPASLSLTGLTPFSFAAGATPIISDRHVSANILVGNFGSEVALIADAGEQSQGFTLAGVDNLPGQAVVYAAAHEVLIGEEMFAAGAYLRAGRMHRSSLLAQDIVRWLIVAAIFLGGITKLLQGMLR